MLNLFREAKECIHLYIKNNEMTLWIDTLSTSRARHKAPTKVESDNPKEDAVLWTMLGFHWKYPLICLFILNFLTDRSIYICHLSHKRRTEKLESK